MADVRWVLVERCQGEMRRITSLDDDFGVVTTHERPGADPDEAQLLRAVELTGRLRSWGAPAGTLAGRALQD